MLEGHSSSVNCLAVFPGSNVVASGAADGTVKIWRFSIQEMNLHVEQIQHISLSPKFFPLTLALHTLYPSSQGLVLAVAGTRSTVQVFVASKMGQFSHQVTLTGHEGWIRSLAFSPESRRPDSDILLASASQDKYIRLWRIAKDKITQVSEQTDLLGAFEQSLSNKTHRLKGHEESYILTFEALLLGHEDWIYTVSWYLRDEDLQLLSASEDNSLAIWEREESSGVWVPTTRLGEISATKGSTTATGSAGGFWIGLWSPTGEQLVSLGRTGSWRLWNYDLAHQRWSQGIGIGGHTKPVMGIAWSKNGSYLLSTGSDQTTRLHAEWKWGAKRSWHEMARPQIHGYDLNCIDTIGDTQCISGADEKLLRVFDEPRATADLLDGLCGIKTEAHNALPEAANIPMLGLSNKAIDAGTNGVVDVDDAEGLEKEETRDVASLSLELNSVPDHPPTEDRLARHTLWPEREKLYGHGHEMSAVAVSHNGSIVATSCKASSQDHAVIRLFTTKDWREVKPPLTAHSLTVTSLRFSNDDLCLLSVGRDRQWAVWERDDEHPEIYSLKRSDPKGHSRMILNACWAPTEVGKVFATAGRDKCVRVWEHLLDTTYCVATIAMSSSVTAVDIAPRQVRGCLLLAIGTETGSVFLPLLKFSDWSVSYSQEVGEELHPSKSVSQLAWRPPYAEVDDGAEMKKQQGEFFQLAIASEDSSLRLLTVVCNNS